MDFIECLFGIAPDGGSGSLEFLLLLLPVAGIVLLAWRRSQRKRHRIDR
jgi:hypothetical protein